MSVIPHFAAYAAAFEAAYASDDWSLVAPGVPDLRFELEETVWLDGERIRRMEDRYDAATIADLEAYLREHGAKLGITLG